MSTPNVAPRHFAGRALPMMLILAAAALFLMASPVFAEQAYVSRYDAYIGYAFLDSPHVSLFEPGVAMQFGFRPKTWYSFGFDYSISAGDLKITPDLLPTTLQQTLGGQLAKLVAAGVIPASYALSVPAHSATQTFAVGPQLAYRKLSRVTLFLRPVFAGAIREVATPKPGDPIATGIVKQLTPAGKKRDWTGFYGFGGGVDLIVSKHIALRTQADLVYDHLFNDILRDGRFTYRFSIGPAFNFGRDIRK